MKNVFNEIYCSKRFQKDFSKACRDNHGLSGAFDTFLTALRGGVSCTYHIKKSRMPPACARFDLYKDKDLHLQGGRGAGGGFRTVHALYEDDAFFVMIYKKSQQSDLQESDRKRICQTMNNAKTNGIESEFLKLDKPCSRAIAGERVFDKLRRSMLI